MVSYKWKREWHLSGLIKETIEKFGNMLFYWKKSSMFSTSKDSQQCGGESEERSVKLQVYEYLKSCRELRAPWVWSRYPDALLGCSCLSVRSVFRAEACCSQSCRETTEDKTWKITCDSAADGGKPLIPIKVQHFWPKKTSDGSQWFPTCGSGRPRSGFLVQCCFVLSSQASTERSDEGTCCWLDCRQTEWTVLH